MKHNQIKILLEHQPLDIDELTDIRFRKTFISTSSSQHPSLSLSELSLPITSANRRVMGFSEQCAAESFNKWENSIEIVVDDRVLFRGVATLRRVERKGDTGRYVLALHSNVATWQERLATKSLAELPIEYQGSWDANAIEQSWSDDTPVRFLPVTRDVVAGENSPTTIFNVVKTMAFDNYHPFLNLRTVIRKMFESEGYTVDSIFMSSPMFRRLYMSGAYPIDATGSLERRMGFLARRIESTTVAADYSGSVYVSPLIGGATLGNLVDVDTAAHFDDTYTNGGCLSVDKFGRVIFTPKEAVVVSFLYELRYQTEYVIRDRERLTGFDRVWITPSECHSFEIANTFVDQRDKPLKPDMEYNVVVFNHTPGAIYQLTYERNNELSTLTLDDRSNIVTLGEMFDEIGEIVQFAVSKDGGSTFQQYDDDWALYYGFVAERGTADVALTLRSAPERITPSSPKNFAQMVFDGAIEGMTLRMESGVSIQPIFYSLPDEESFGGWESVAAVECTQKDVVDAVCSMFNLRVIEDAKTRTVRIERADYLAYIAQDVDWSDKIDISQGWTCEDLSYDMAKVIRLEYQSDSKIRSWEEQHNQLYASWDCYLDAACSTLDIEERKVALFHPSFNSDRICAEAPSASIIATGDSGNIYHEERLNFPIKVAVYAGLKTLPEDEVWGWPTYANEYPYAAFHSPEYGFTLCFEDRDGVEGLHSYYDRQARLWNSAKRVMLSVELEPWEVMSLCETSSAEAAERNRYRFELDGEQHLFTLESLEYSSQSPIAKCTFIKID